MPPPRRAIDPLLGYRDAVLEVGPRVRVAVAACWITGQAALVLTAPLRPDHIFGFSMFPEASTMEIHLAREVNGQRVPTPHGKWSAHDVAGQTFAFSWEDRIRDPTLAVLDARIFASYGIDAQLARLQRALDDVADHVPDDAETERLVAEVTVWKNGREPISVLFFSHRRRRS